MLSLNLALFFRSPGSLACAVPACLSPEVAGGDAEVGKRWPWWSAVSGSAARPFSARLHPVPSPPRLLQ